MSNLTKKQKIIKTLTPIALFFIKIYWFIFRPTSYGVKVILEKDDKLLLVKNDYGKRMWTFPGGNVEKGEGYKQAALREVREELGIDVLDMRHLGEFVSTEYYKYDTVNVFVGTPAQEEIIKDDFEIQEFKWFPKDKLPPIGHVAQMTMNLYEN